MDTPPIESTIDEKKVYPTKVYLVFQVDNVAPVGQPNIRVIACKLNQTAAQAVVNTMPGSYIEKVYANKIPMITPLMPPPYIPPHARK